jgi:GH15 family glucan-1,4-alpha-glucosidase
MAMNGARPIRDYALVGDCHGAALISSEGSVDWCALLRFDGDPVFFRLLDAARGGSWTVAPEGVVRTSRAYRPRTNILVTRFETRSGVLEVADFMPVGRKRTAGVHDYVTLNAPGWLVRRFSCVAGWVRLVTRFCPREEGFRLEPPAITLCEGRVACEGGLSLWHGGEAAREEDGVTIRLDLREGETESCVMTRIPPLVDPRAHCDDLLATTEAFWREWTEYSRYRGPYAEAVERSALALKLLTYAPTGAIVAAATTSLPEEIGGGRNWDYRFSWIRDATFALFSLSVLGYSGEGRRFSEFLTRRCLREGAQLRIMYSIEGEPFLPEQVLDHLEGYRGSRPVRTGNGAAEQRQLDVFGEILDWAELRANLGARLTADEKGLLKGIADHVCATWRVPDQGLWEARSEPREYVQGKAMAWVTLDRAARLLGDRDLWRKTREAIVAAILREGTAGDPPFLAQAFGVHHPDAALLQIPLLGLPLDGDLLDRTVRRVEEELRSGDFVYRYRGADGVEGEEGAFFITSFWLVEALLVTGRAEEAQRLFERLLEETNDVGLYAEEIDPASREFLGNFPQAFTHLALISSAALLHLHEIGGRRAIEGTNTDRARRLVGATEGTRALLYALIRNRGVRLLSSKKSVLALT